jgi:hypothetical protein
VYKRDGAETAQLSACREWIDCRKNPGDLILSFALLAR